MYETLYLLIEDLLTKGIIDAGCPAAISKTFSVHIVWKRKVKKGVEFI